MIHGEQCVNLFAYWILASQPLKEAVAMPQCFRCGSHVNSTDVNCKTCGVELKAFGHQGIELYRAQDNQSLCCSCMYHADDSCDYDKRPFAKDCTMYRDVDRQIEAVKRPGARQPGSVKQPLMLITVVIGLLLLAIVMR